MNAMIGELGLGAAMVVSALSLVACLGAVRFGTASYFRIARAGFGVFAGLMVVASVALVRALVLSDYSVAYVASYTETALPMGYKLSAFWAGQEGSLLFWALVLSLMSAVFVFVRRRHNDRRHAWTLFTLALICGFFAAMTLFAANPFGVSDPVPSDGHGLNPMLQNIGMIAHPPTLFVGYAGFTIPFALMIGSLLSGAADNAWIGDARRWALLSWLFLSIGIVLGAGWAYVELGWGGYWAWDPVENASLLPWLTGTALLHSMAVGQQRFMFKRWNAGLAAVTFLLCIFGTYLTRSGVIQSVHAFQKSLIGSFFLGFLIVTTLVSVLLLIVRWRRLGGAPLQGLLSKEGAVLLGNALLVFMMALTLLGTVFPLVSDMVAGNALTVTQSFYNKSVLPLAVLMLLLMGVAPLLGYGLSRRGDLGARLRWPAMVSAISTAIVLIAVGFSFWTLCCTLAIVLTLTAILADYVAVVLVRRKNDGDGLVRAAIGAIDANHRRYGGHLAHLGIAMVVAGVAGSSLHSTKATLELQRGQSATVGRHTITLDSVRAIREGNYEAAEAVVKVVSPGRPSIELRPQIRRYDKAEQNSAEIALVTGLREDVYLSLAGIENEAAAALQVVINPLVIWIWIGGGALVLGGIWSMLPQLLPSRKIETQAAQRPGIVAQTTK